jgi:glycosyltransferase involved in cell wall biosynthesis
MKVAILYDVIGWAYYSEAVGLKKYINKNTKCIVDTYSYPFFYEKLSSEIRNSYDSVLLYPRQAKNITYSSENTAVRFSSFGDYKKQSEINTKNFGYFICMNKQIEKKAKLEISDKFNIIKHIPVAVDTNFFCKNKNKTNANKLNIGFIGNKNRPNDSKGYALIKQAVQNLDKYVNFYVASYDKEDRVKPNEMPDFYNKLDLIICMSTDEGGPLPPFEGGACGVTTISSCERSAFGEILVDNFNGFKIDRTSDSLNKKILEIYKNKELLNITSNNIQETIHKNHCWSTIWKEYFEIFNKIKKQS